MRRSVQLCGRRVEYELERKPVKNINLRIHADGSMAVSAPRRVPVKEIEAFLRRKEKTIVAALDRFASAAEAVPPQRLLDGETLLLWGEELTLRLSPGENQVLRQGKELLLSVRDPEDEALRRRVWEGWLRTECAGTMEALCRALYPRFQALGVAFPAIRVRRMRSRWGSCIPAKGSVTFSTGLVHAPRECAEYVAAHELTHLLRADHSPEFYRLLESVLPDWRERKERLRTYGALIR